MALAFPIFKVVFAHIKVNFQVTYATKSVRTFKSNIYAKRELINMTRLLSTLLQKKPPHRERAHEALPGRQEVQMQTFSFQLQIVTPGVRVSNYKNTELHV